MLFVPCTSFCLGGKGEEGGGIPLNEVQRAENQFLGTAAESARCSLLLEMRFQATV